MNVTGNVGDLTALMENIAREHEPRAARRAADRTRDRVVTNTRRTLATDHRIPQAVTRKRAFRGRSATVKNPVATFKVGTWVVPVQKMGAVTARKKGGVSYNMPGGRVTDRHAFQVGSLGDSVFARAPGAGRLPIKKKTANIAEPVERTLAKTASESTVAGIFEKEFRSTLDYRVEKELKRWRKAN